MAYATYSDLEARWRPLSAAEQDRATILLEDASQILRDLSPGLDDRVLTDEVSLITLCSVVCAMVKRVMQGPADFDGVTQQQQTAGPFMQGVTFSNPTGDLYLTKFEKRRLGIGQQKAFMVDLIADDEDDES